MFYDVSESRGSYKFWMLTSTHYKSQLQTFAILTNAVTNFRKAQKTVANFDDPQARPYLESICENLVSGLAHRHASAPPMPSLPTL